MNDITYSDILSKKQDNFNVQDKYIQNIQANILNYYKNNLIYTYFKIINNLKYFFNQ